MAENTDTPEESPVGDHDEAPDTAAPADEATTDAGTPEAATNEAVPADEAAAPRSRLRDRAFTFRSVVAVGVATLLLGGAGGAAVVAVTSDGHDGRHRVGRFADGPGRDGGGPDHRNGPGFGPQNGFPSGPGGRLERREESDDSDQEVPEGDTPPAPPAQQEDPGSNS